VVLMARHRHTVSVRTDGLQAVLGPLAADRHVLGAALVDVDSGMVLDAWSSQWGRSDTEIVGAVHAEIVRVALGPPGGPAPGAVEVVLSRSDGRYDVVRTVADPFGDRLALSVVLVGSRRVLQRTRRRLRVVSESALTAGPSMARRPGAGGWTPPAAGPPPVTASPQPAARRQIPASHAPRDPAIMSLSPGRQVPERPAPPVGLRAVPDLLGAPARPVPIGWAERPPAPLPALAPAPPRRVPEAEDGSGSSVLSSDR
jgi:hypothetical protein